MNTSKIVLGIVVYVMLCGRPCVTAVVGDDSNSTKKTPLTKPEAPTKPAVVQTPQQVIVQQQYVRDPSYDKRAAAVEQNQRATDQQVANLRQDLDNIRADLHAISSQSTKYTTADANILTKLDRIEKLMGNMNGRLKKLEERVDRQDVKIRKIKNAQDAAPIAKEPNDVNQPVASR